MAKWGGGGGKNKLQPGRYIAQVRNVSADKSKKPNDRGEYVDQFKWSLDIQQVGGNGQWTAYTIWTKQAFSPPDSSPQFTSLLTKLVRATGARTPQTEAEALAWNENEMIGKQFAIIVEPNPEDPSVFIERYTTLQFLQQMAAPQQHYAPPAHPAPNGYAPAPGMAPAAIPAPPGYGQPAMPPQYAAPVPGYPPNGQYPQAPVAPPGYGQPPAAVVPEHDPFSGDAGAQNGFQNAPVGAAAATAVTGAADDWT